MTANEPLKNVLINQNLAPRAMKEHDREMLKRLLPEGVAKDEKWIETVVNDLFTGKVFHFDNPAERVWNQIRRHGYPHSFVIQTDQERVAETKLVFNFEGRNTTKSDNLDQMRKLWMRLDEETGMKERRKIWEDYLEMKAQRKKTEIRVRKKNALTKQKKQAKVEGDSVIEGSETEKVA